MKKTKFVLLTSVILVLVFVLCACDFVIKDFAKYSEAMTKSMDSVTSVSSHITMQDQGVLVYEYQRNMAIDGNNATITTVEKTLNSSFQLAETSNTEQKSGVDRAQLLPISLSQYSAKDLKMESDKLSCTVSAEDFASVMKLGSYEIGGNANITCEFEKKTLTKITCEFDTKDGKHVQIVHEFNY